MSSLPPVGQLARRSLLLLILAAAVAACGSSGQPSASERAQGLLTAGLTAQLQGRTAEAVDDYNRVLALDPKNKFAYYNLGLIDQQMGRLDMAEKNYRTVLGIDPNFDRALFNLAILRTNSDPAEAEALYRRVIAIAPNSAAAHLNLGFLLISTGRQADGRAELQKAVALDPTLASRIPAPSPAPKKP